MTYLKNKYLRYILPKYGIIKMRVIMIYDKIQKGNKNHSNSPTVPLLYL